MAFNNNFFTEEERKCFQIKSSRTPPALPHPPNIAYKILQFDYANGLFAQHYREEV